MSDALKPAACGADMEVFHIPPEKSNMGAPGFYLTHNCQEDYPKRFTCVRNKPHGCFATHEAAVEAWDNFIHPAEIKWYAEGGSPERFGRDHDEVITKLAEMLMRMK